MKDAKGLAIYFPESSYSFSSEYLKLAWAKESQWDEMVKDYYKKSTSNAIIADIENGDVSSLINFAQNVQDKEIGDYVISKLNFRVFSEGGFSPSIQENVANLINQIKAK